MGLHSAITLQVPIALENWVGMFFNGLVDLPTQTLCGKFLAYHHDEVDQMIDGQSINRLPQSAITSQIEFPIVWPD